jgi:hypothetical protein
MEFHDLSSPYVSLIGAERRLHYAAVTGCAGVKIIIFQPLNGKTEFFAVRQAVLSVLYFCLFSGRTSGWRILQRHLLKNQEGKGPRDSLI